MTITVSGSNITFSDSTTQTSGGAPAKAWVAFTTTSSGNPTVTAGYNVSSITFVTYYAFQINFTTSFSDANYCATGMAQFYGYSNSVGVCYSANYAQTASNCTVTPFNASFPSTFTPILINVAFFR
jgi:hypothetical protein